MMKGGTPRNKPSGRRFKPNGRYAHIAIERNVALTFASQTLAEFHRHKRLPSISAIAASKRVSKQASYNELFAALYHKACGINPRGHDAFINGITEDNLEKHLVRATRERANELIRNWEESIKPPTRNSNDPKDTHPSSHTYNLHYRNRCEHHPATFEMMPRQLRTDEQPFTHRSFMTTIVPEDSLEQDEEHESTSQRSITMSDTT
jgi:hypothetical protein